MALTSLPFEVVTIGGDVALVVRLGRADRLAGSSNELSAFADWLALAVAHGVDGATASADLYASYREFAATIAIPSTEQLSFTAFGRSLTRAGLVKVKGADGRIYRRRVRLRSGYGVAPAHLPRSPRAARG